MYRIAYEIISSFKVEIIMPTIYKSRQTAEHDAAYLQEVAKNSGKTISYSVITLT